MVQPRLSTPRLHSLLEAILNTNAADVKALVTSQHAARQLQMRGFRGHTTATLCKQPDGVRAAVEVLQSQADGRLQIPEMWRGTFSGKAMRGLHGRSYSVWSRHLNRPSVSAGMCRLWRNWSARTFGHPKDIALIRTTLKHIVGRFGNGRCCG